MSSDGSQLESEESCDNYLKIIYSYVPGKFLITQQRLSKTEQLQQIKTIVHKICERKNVDMPRATSPEYYHFIGMKLKEMFDEK